ncbi:MAG: hypothetical protein IJ764_08320 [Bacteroidales bacterium]|nr:hypothetical protein [Bacteroidales bacterium]
MKRVFVTLSLVALMAIIQTGLEGQTPEGAVRGKFSVSDGRQVRFSKGNLQYQASSGTWRFAEHQYDMIGAAAGNNATSGRESQEDWIDLFGWGTSGWNEHKPSGKEKYPYSISRDYQWYGPVGNSSLTDLTGDSASYDWGVYNKISNGGNKEGMWRTLTKDEWVYLFNERTCEYRYVLAKVNDVVGMIIFADGYIHPAGVTEFQHVNEGLGRDGSPNAEDNAVSSEDWAKIEKAGAVFLPAAGRRYRTSVFEAGSDGYYWSATHSSAYGAYHVYFYDSSFSPDYYNYRNARFSVRLVQDN